jgi:hypothetical protein
MINEEVRRALNMIASIDLAGAEIVNAILQNTILEARIHSLDDVLRFLETAEDTSNEALKLEIQAMKERYAKEPQF